MPRILIVDDEEPIRKLMAVALSRPGYEIHTATGSYEALALIDGPLRFDLVLCDVLMPGMDGHQLTREIAQRWPATHTILVSGYDPIDCDVCPYVSRCTLVAKPFRFARLLAVVEEALSGQAPTMKKAPPSDLA